MEGAAAGYQARRQTQRAGQAEQAEQAEHQAGKHLLRNSGNFLENLAFKILF